ncbi:MAG: glycosyltransferase family 2 protein [Opitutales bacterium]|nr:glycosyltransferase family 2 protein [Opitutales bacterium]
MALKVAVLVPCYNEEASVGMVVREFKHHLPDAKIYVYDNNSTDNTAEKAREAGAIVRREVLQGKGNVVRRMFADISAEIYILVDGDATYDASCAPAMIDMLIQDQLDMVTGVRCAFAQESYRSGHRFGNWMFSTLISRIFGDRITDLLSGYRVFSRRFVKSFPVLSNSFEIETEFTVHALELKMPLGEMKTPYGARPPGSVSKLSTFRDGFKILWLVFTLVKNERPLPLFGGCAIVIFIFSVILCIPLLLTYFETGLVPRLPTAILVVGLLITGTLSFFSGIILDNVTRGRQELKRLQYLSQPGPKDF